MTQVIGTDEAASDEWMKQWRELTEEISKVWPIGVSAVDVISEMRNARGQGFILENEAAPKNENEKC